MPFSGALTATVLIAFTMTLLMGLYAQAAVRGGAGHGPQRVLRLHDRPADSVPWQTALGMVFWAGVLFLLVSATPLRERIATAIPAGLRVAAAGRHRAAADVHRLPQRRPDRGRPGDARPPRRARPSRRIPAARHRRRRRAAAPPQPVRVSRLDLRGDGARLALRLRHAAGAAHQPAGFLVGLPEARRRRRAAAGAASRPSSRSCSPICSTRCRRSSACRAPPG